MNSSYFRVMQLNISDRSLAFISLMVAVMIWGIATPVIKSTIEYVPPLTFLMLRFLFAGLVTLPMTIYYFRKIKLNLDRIKKIIIASSLGHIASLTLIFIGLGLTSSSGGSIITSFSPLIITIMGFFILKEHITRKEIEGTLLAFIGALVIIFEPLIFKTVSAETARLAFIGNIIFFFGLIADGYYSIYVKKNLSEDKLITPFMQVCISFIFAAIVFIPLSVAEQYYSYTKTESGSQRICDLRDIDKYNYSTGTICDTKGCFPTKERYNYFCLNTNYKTTFRSHLVSEYSRYVTSNSVAGILYMAFLSGLVAYTAYNMGLKRIEASEASVFYYLQPVFGIPISIFFLGESISIMFAVGAAIIVTGIYLVEKR